MREVTYKVDPFWTRKRLDLFLSNIQKEISRSQVQRLIEQDHVSVNGQPVSAKYKVKPGDIVQLRVPDPTPLDLSAEPIPLNIVFEDECLVVVDKPAGMVVHPAPGHATGTLVHALLHHCQDLSGIGGVERPGIVHRLDKDTTGVIVVARTDLAYQALTSAFAERRVKKLYLAMVFGLPKETRGSIELPIGRHPSRRKEMTVRPGGRPARTDYDLISSENGISLLDVDLATGRTHQIRVHLKALGHPLIGDPIYGEARWKGLDREVRRPLQDFSRPALHAWRLQLAHPVSGQPLRVEAPIPTDLKGLWQDVTGRELPELPAW